MQQQLIRQKEWNSRWNSKPKQSRTGTGRLMALSLSLSLFLALVCCPGLVHGQDAQFFRFTGTMSLSPVATTDELSADAIVHWETTTSQFYVDALLARTDLDPPVSNPEFDVSLLFAARPTDDQSGTVMEMQYRATASFVSDSTEYDPGFLALPSFRSQEDILVYVVNLRSSGHAIFEDLSSISLSVQASNPIAAPTPRPVSTPSPTPAPTVAPTPAPVPATSAPAFSLTESPTRTPVATPTVTTDSPTVKATDEVTTRSPVIDEPTTDEPTKAPTETTEPPVTAPTDYPTLPPATMAPGLKTLFTTTELVLEFLPGEMEGDALDIWTRATETYITDYVQALESDLLTSSSLRIGRTTQRVLSDERQLLRQRRGRSLQDDTTTGTYPLSVEFVSSLDLPPTLDASSLVTGAFLTNSRREAYRTWIQDAVLGSSAEAFFQSLVEIRFFEEDPPNEPDPPAEEGGSMGALIAGVVGGLLVLLVLGFVIYKKVSGTGGTGKDTTSSSDLMANQTHNASPTSQGGNNKSDSAAHNTGLSWEPAEQPSRLNQEILFGDSMDDVSTIGDPYLYGQPAGLHEDERTATTSVFQTETYNSLLGRQRDLSHEQSMRSTADESEFSAFTGASKYLGHGSAYHAPKRGTGLLGELGIAVESDETSFEQRLFPMDNDDDGPSLEERSLDYSLPTALM